MGPESEVVHEFGIRSNKKNLFWVEIFYDTKDQKKAMEGTDIHAQPLNSRTFQYNPDTISVTRGPKLLELVLLVPLVVIGSP